METHARHFLVGLFTLALIAAGFAFVYWIKGGGGMQARAEYIVEYEKSIAGLASGSPVLFNGKRVGEVASIALNNTQPDHVSVRVSIDRATPVRTDTRATIDFQGLAGAPAVSLLGGAEQSAPFKVSGGVSPIIIADKDSGVTLGSAARQAVLKVNDVIADNQAALHNVIENLRKFTDALGRNSDRVDGILAGLSKMTGGSGAKAGVYDLTAAPGAAKSDAATAAHLAVAEPSIAFSLGQDKIMSRSGDLLTEIDQSARWCEPLVTLFQSRLIQSFENAGYLGRVTKPLEGVQDIAQLAIDIRHFEIVPDTKTADVEFSARLIGPDGKVIVAKIFSQTQPLEGTDMTAAAAHALNAAYGQLSGDVVGWVSATLKNAPRRS